MNDDVGMDRQNSMRFHTSADECLRAADILYEAGWTDPVPTILFLIGQSIELSLKSFLRGSGYSIQDLRNPKKFGHNIENALVAAQEHGLESLIILTAEEIELIHIINDPYKRKDLQYVSVGLKVRPPVQQSLQIARRLKEALQEFAEKNRRINDWEILS